jgi:hypothetical protein
MSDFDNLTIKEQEEKIIEWLAHFYNGDKDVIEIAYSRRNEGYVLFVFYGALIT